MRSSLSTTRRSEASSQVSTRIATVYPTPCGALGLDVGVWHKSRTVLTLLIMLAAISPPPVKADGQGDVGLVGNQAIVWAFQRRADAQGNELLIFAYRPAGTEASTRFRRLPMDPVTGRVVRAVVLGVDLHVFFGDGTHRRYMPPRRTMWSAAPPRVQVGEVTLPGSAVPMALAADVSHPVLYALIAGQEANRIEHLGQGDTDSIEAAAPDETEHVPSGDSAERVASDCALVRYEGGRWLRDRDAPLDLTPDTDVLGLLAAGAVIHVIYRAEEESPHYVHRVSPAPNASWGEARPLPLKYEPTHRATGFLNDKPVLLVGRREKEGTTVQSFGRVNEAWTTGAVLQDDEGQPVMFQRPLALALVGSQVAVMTVGDSGDALVGRWVLETGRPLEPLERLAALTPIPRLRPHSSARAVIQYVILTGVLTAVFVWRRGSMLTPASLKPGQTPARFSRRAVALFIDMLILAPVWGLALFLLIQRTPPDLSPAERLILGVRIVARDGLWWWAILGAIVGLYATVLEAATGSTAGKRLVGLRVVSDDGDRCRLAQIMVRNAARIIEFPLAPLLLLVALTPSRKRLGDIFARTVVVEWDDLSSEASSGGEDPTDVLR